MPHIYVIDSPLMLGHRKKIINAIEYTCGRNYLIEYALTQGSCTYVYTGPRDKTHEDFIKSHFDRKKLEVIPALSNNMRDFSGYLSAVEDAIEKKHSDVIFCNSSCPPLGQKLLASIDCRIIVQSIVGIGAKSFYRNGLFCIKINPHLQTYALRMVGSKPILSFFNFMHECQGQFSQIGSLNELEYKRYLIEKCEIGLNNYFRNLSLNRYFLSESGALIVVPNAPTTKFPFLDSRKNDSRFVI